MKCLKCGASASHVIDSRPSMNTVRRRRRCHQCNRRWTTYEISKTHHPSLLIVDTKAVQKVVGGLVKEILEGATVEASDDLFMSFVRGDEKKETT